MNGTFYFPEGLLGFEEVKELTLTPLDLAFDATFYELRASGEELGFLAVDPFKVAANYSLLLDDQTQQKLDTEASEDIMVLSLVTLNDTLDTSTTNLKAPLLFNLRTKKACQWVHPEATISVKHPLKGEA